MSKIIGVTVGTPLSASSVANSLKGTASGSAVAMKDVSPLEHNIGVKLSSDTITDFSSVTLKKYGKNVLPHPWRFTSPTKTGGLTYTDNGDGGFSIVGDITATNEIYLIKDPLPAGTYAFSITGELPRYTSCTVKLYDPELKKMVKNFGDVTSTKKFVTFTITEEDAKTCQVWINVYSAYQPDRYTYETLNLVLYPQIELGTTATEYEPYKKPISYNPKADGTVEGVTSLYPTTTLLTDTEGVTITAEYNRDLNKAFAEIYQAIATMGAPVMTIPEEV